MRNAQTIRTLLELLAANRDGENDLRLCAEHARNEKLRALLLERARERAKATIELRSLVRQLGGDPAQQDIRPAHRGRIDMCAALAGRDDAMLDQCERCEGYTLEIHRNALDDHLPDFVQRVVQRHFESAMRHHEKLTSLRSSITEAEMARERAVAAGGS